jgi:hypothetical protein
MLRARMHRLGLVGVVASALVMCAAAIPMAAGAATPSTTKVVLSNASNGKTVTAEKGDVVVVKLDGHGTLRWSEASVVPTSSATAPVLVKKSGHLSPDGSSRTRFSVVGYGSATLQAEGTARCGIAQDAVCPMFVLLWRATVSVPVVDPAGRAS